MAWGLALLAGGCAALPPPTPPAQPAAEMLPPEFVSAPVKEAAPKLIAAERQAAIDRDLSALAQLWAADSRVVDARGTSASDDDMVWPGKAAVLDRYVVAVFPNPPPPLGDLAGARLHIEGDDRATLDVGGDRWRFVHKDGRWWLAELVYNAP